MITIWEHAGIADMSRLGKEILGLARSSRVLLFKGDLGAGKTTLIREICRGLDVADDVQSPTFSIVNEYRRLNGDPVYHFDLYRLKNEHEAFDIGIEQYLASGYFCMVEWPDQFAGLFQRNCPVIALEHQDGARKITLTYE